MFNDKTLLFLARHIGANYSLRQAKELFVEIGLASFDELDELERVIKIKPDIILRVLRENNDSSNDTKFVDLFTRVLRFKPSPELVGALQLEGWDISELSAIPLAGKLATPAHEESALKAKLEDKGLKEVIHLLEQSYDNYTQDHFEAANAMTRSALESLVRSIAERLSKVRSEPIPQSSARLGYQPRDYRDYLRQAGFLEEDEYELLRVFYGYASGEGSHPGLSNRTEARLRRFILVALSFFYLEKMDAKGI